MTVAVSIASGVAAITSAYPSMQPATVWIGVGVIVILLAGNLRGVRQAGAMFAVPTYAFIAAIAALVVAGLVHAAGRGFHPVPVRHLAIVQAVTVLLALRAFAAGSTAMTGIEAISNAVPAFKPQVLDCLAGGQLVEGAVGEFLPGQLAHDRRGALVQPCLDGGGRSAAARAG
jgi:amino acid transporter